MSDTAITALNDRIQDLTRQLSEARSEAKDRRVKGRKLTAENEQLKAQVANLTQSVNEWKQKAESNPTQLQQQLDAANAKIRDRVHRDAIQTLYDDASLDLSKSVPIDTLLKLIDYKAEGDTPDLQAVKARIVEAQKGNAFLKGQHGDQASQNAAGAAQPGSKPALDNGLADAGGRGARDTNARLLRITKADTRDPEFMRKNQQAIAEHSKAGTLQILD
jgi:hypothetical protein